MLLERYVLESVLHTTQMKADSALTWAGVNLIADEKNLKTGMICFLSKLS